MGALGFVAVTKLKPSLRKSQAKPPAEQVVKDSRRQTRRHFPAKDRIRIALESPRGQDSIAELCRKEVLMDAFIRRFPFEILGTQRHSSGIAALFERWVLPGENAEEYGLRLAIRNGYLNFYVKGQSVGELRMLDEWPRLKLHRKYLEIAEKGSLEAGDLGQKYAKIDVETLSRTGPDAVEAWIQTAETYAGDEKRFVDHLVAVTAGTIDMEMALPADDDAVERSAPRMDLVVAQGQEIAFWEAKCAVNGELRARAPYREAPDGSYIEGPHVLWQLRRYERWVGRPHRLEQVRSAYIATAQQLLALAEMFGKRGPAIDAWRVLAGAGKGASVILPPGIVIADYCPACADGKARDKAVAYAAKVRSFPDHEARLVAHGTTVARVNQKPERAVLPHLMPGAISDKEKQP